MTVLRLPNKGDLHPFYALQVTVRRLVENHAALTGRSALDALAEVRLALLLYHDDLVNPPAPPEKPAAGA